jgi:hypothetical protein
LHFWRLALAYRSRESGFRFTREVLLPGAGTTLHLAAGKVTEHQAPNYKLQFGTSLSFLFSLMYEALGAGIAQSV